MKILDDACILTGGKCFAWLDINFNRKGVAFVQGRFFGIVESEDGATAKRFTDEIATAISP